MVSGAASKIYNRSAARPLLATPAHASLLPLCLNGFPFVACALFRIFDFEFVSEEQALDMPKRLLPQYQVTEAAGQYRADYQAMDAALQAASLPVQCLK